MNANEQSCAARGRYRGVQKSGDVHFLPHTSIPSSRFSNYCQHEPHTMDLAVKSCILSHYIAVRLNLRSGRNKPSSKLVDANSAVRSSLYGYAEAHLYRVTYRVVIFHKHRAGDVNKH
jgi:hypothetical protein